MSHSSSTTWTMLFWSGGTVRNLPEIEPRPGDCLLFDQHRGEPLEAGLGARQGQQVVLVRGAPRPDGSDLERTERGFVGEVDRRVDRGVAQLGAEGEDAAQGDHDAGVDIDAVGSRGSVVV